MTSDQHHAWARIADIRLVMVIRQPSAQAALSQAEDLVQAGIACVEIALTTPGAPAAITDLRERFPDALIGAGTVLDAPAAAASIDAGAQFLVSPGLADPVLDVARNHGVLAIPGVQTPTEIMQAIRWDVHAVKLFPAATLSPGHLRALRPVFPEMQFVPTGGISSKNAPEWFEAGAAAIGVGSAAAGPAGDEIPRLLAVAAASGR